MIERYCLKEHPDPAANAAECVWCNLALTHPWYQRAFGLPVTAPEPQLPAGASPKFEMTPAPFAASGSGSAPLVAQRRALMKLLRVKFNRMVSIGGCCPKVVVAPTFKLMPPRPASSEVRVNYCGMRYVWDWSVVRSGQTIAT